ncbi:hypothetical protein [Panacagrimonas sp.]|uniref:hypothetical protein n=1 Tax=Panacagrimonas sp. TaxID=2480088 RepID=UPI003B52167E
MSGMPADFPPRRALRCSAINPAAWLLTWALLAVAAGNPSAAADKPFAQHAYEHMLSAIASNSFEDFTALGDVVFQSLKREEFDKVCQHFIPLLAAGQRSTYLGSFQLHGMTVHYWRLSFAGERDDWLAKLAVKDERVRGFFISPP